MAQKYFPLLHLDEPKDIKSLFHYLVWLCFQSIVGRELLIKSETNVGGLSLWATEHYSLSVLVQVNAFSAFFSCRYKEVFCKKKHEQYHDEKGAISNHVCLIAKRSLKFLKNTKIRSKCIYNFSVRLFNHLQQWYYVAQKNVPFVGLSKTKVLIVLKNQVWYIYRTSGDK